MIQKGEKVILDTNILISFLIKKDFKRLDEKIKKGRVRLIFSEESLEEFLTVAHREKFRKYFKQKDIIQLLDLFSNFGELVTVRSNVNICRDKKDNFLLALSKDSKADYLLTMDNDLLILREFYGTKIITIMDYLKKYIKG